MANLETTFAGGPPYSGYPNFNSPDELADGLLDAGFDLLLTANNHCMDKGFSGLCRTLDVLDQVGIAHVGTSRTEEEAQSNIVVADVGGISVAFIGYTYGTNGIPLSKKAPFSVNLFNTDYLTSLSTLDEKSLLSALDQAKALNPDLIAVMIHWGIEYKTKQNAYQERVTQFLLDHGADIVLGGHPHVLQPMELRTLERDGEEKQGFVCYSLGNFISSQTYALTDTTVILALELTRDNKTGITQVTDYSYTPMYMLNRRKSDLFCSTSAKSCQPVMTQKSRINAAGRWKAATRYWELSMRRGSKLSRIRLHIYSDRRLLSKADGRHFTYFQGSSDMLLFPTQNY